MRSADDRRCRRWPRHRRRCCRAAGCVRAGPPPAAAPALRRARVPAPDRGARGSPPPARAPRRGLRAPRRAHAGQQSRQQRARLLALHRVEIAVARGHRQPVGLPHDRHALNLDAQVEVGDHLPDQRQLLVVLLAEVRAVGSHRVEQLEHDGQYPGEMRWPRGALQLGAQLSGDHGGAGAVRIHVVGGRSECDLHTLGPQRVEVVVERARVRVEVLARPELQRVDEDRHHDDGTRHPAGGADQRQMSVVQRAHRGHQHDTASGRAQSLRDARDIAGTCVDVEFPRSEFRGSTDVHRCPASARASKTSSGACAR